MNCLDFRKYAGAFADNELDTERNLDALEHLKMCPACVRRVDGIHAMRRSLQRAYASDKAPDRLRQAVVAGISARRRTAPRWLRWAVPPVAVAAAIACVFLAQRVLMAPAPPDGVVSSLAVDVRVQHTECEHHGADHHDPRLPRELEAAAAALSDQLQVKVIAPDLSVQGLEFVGAARCGIMGLRGAHILYRQGASGPYVSLFAVSRVEGLPAGYRSATTGASYFRSASSDGLSVVAWHEGRQTYVVTGDVSSERLLQIADAASTTGAGSPTEPLGDQP